MMLVRIADVHAVGGDRKKTNVAGTDLALEFKETPACTVVTRVQLGRFDMGMGSGGGKIIMGLNTEWIPVMGEEGNQAARWLSNLATKKDPHKFKHKIHIKISGSICVFKCKNEVTITLFRDINQDNKLDVNDGDGELICKRPYVETKAFFALSGIDDFFMVMGYSIDTQKLKKAG